MTKDNTVLKPTNEQIESYIYKWIESFDGDGLIITDNETIVKALERAKQENFTQLRSLFAPDKLYNSIQEYTDSLEDES